ncbi:MAG: cation diffusion facilitator family transporter [Anaerolineales bacterium]|nr:cation diffusion facilitator family transporter [Anaerolineales bacterium]
MLSIRDGVKVSGGAIAINIILAIVKISTGILGGSYALIADGIESTTDIFSSLIVWSGLRLAAKPPDQDHPFGHGKAESISGLIVASFLVISALVISFQSIREIQTPHGTPAWYTLAILGAIIITKELLFRRMFYVGATLQSGALKSDAWHHRSDALTSFAAFVGISIALIGGSGYEAADDWAALIACLVILYNAYRLFRPALDEVMDAAVPSDIEHQIRHIASGIEGVCEIEKTRIRKSGLGYLMDIHVVVRGDLSVRRGHLIGHAVKSALIESEYPINDIVVHIEPDTHI